MNPLQQRRRVSVITREPYGRTEELYAVSKRHPFQDRVLRSLGLRRITDRDRQFERHLEGTKDTPGNVVIESVVLYGGDMYALGVEITAAARTEKPVLAEEKILWLSHAMRRRLVDLGICKSHGSTAGAIK